MAWYGRRGGGRTEPRLKYVINTKTAYNFDLCEVINCKGNNSTWQGYPIYLCYSKYANEHTAGRSSNGIYEMVSNTMYFNLKRIRLQRDKSGVQNPITLSIQWINMRETTIYLTLGVSITGTDPLGMLKVRVLNTPPKHLPTAGATPPPNENSTTPDGAVPTLVGSDYSTWTPEDILRLTMGYSNDNLWLTWIAGQAREAGMEGCVACAEARPPLYLSTAPLYPNTDPIGFSCLIQMTRVATPPNCTTLSSIFPVIPNNTGSGPFQVPKTGNFTCFRRTKGNVTHPPQLLGEIQSSWCHTIFTDTSNNSVGDWARAGLYYYCGSSTLLLRLPIWSKGLCAMVRLLSPITLFGPSTGKPTLPGSRSRRDVSFDLTKNTPTYIDSIGVPRGVPDEHKLVDQVSAGFESILIWITPNKNVDRINYVNYQVMRLANITGLAVSGLASQLSATSLMTIQNRIALDMLLAEKGGVCHMIRTESKTECCTVIPNNTAPDGSVTKALDALKALSKEMTENTGIDNPLTNWLDRTFGQWKAVFLSLASALAIFVAILVTCGCCCIPCLRTLIERTIVKMFDDKQRPPEYMMSLLEDSLEDNGGSGDFTLSVDLS
ncbi:hypothetical protein AMEX_G9555 [Astyanax mexicanus]|uniref:Envelope glycoprotein n=1 Tax=Astyanax mexicanus TaxID=7994 RepID=A0A8T2LTN0_ASTMX|nr:hypothetical protein AMEX_G9555 [Astyanax mexicanus]